MATRANDFWKTLFSLRGRSGRKRFWLTLGLQFLVALIGGGFVVALSSADLPWASVPFGVALFLGYAALSICNSVKRLHDIGWSGWCMAPILLFELFAGIADLGAGEGGVGTSSALGGIGLLILILFGALPGTDGPNRYGDPPGRSEVDGAEAAAA